jgi:hypothetical protein
MPSKSLSARVFTSLLVVGTAINLGSGAATAAPGDGATAASSPKKAIALAPSAAVAVTTSETGMNGKSKPATRPSMDVAFCIDTTGSMQGEIDMVKKKTKDMVAKLSSGKPAPIVRVGLVAYRDIGDAYITKVFPFSDNIDQVVKDISSLQADGGGDGPEAVDRGIHAAVRELRWSKDQHTAKLLFLIGDAGPHMYPPGYDWRGDCRYAIKNGIQINTMGCHGLESYPEKEGVGVFKEIAKLTDGKFESLAYREEIVDATGKRSVVIHSGGHAYRAKAGVKTDAASWKSAMAKGLVEKISGAASFGSYSSAGAVSASYAAAPTASPSATASPVPHFAAIPPAPPLIRGVEMVAPTPTRSVAPSLSMSAVPMAPAASTMFSTGGMKREENNLDELMLEAAKQKAAKSLHVGY